MNRKLVYRGDTGLRLDGYDGSAIDTTIRGNRGDRLELYICQEGWNTEEAIEAKIEIDETEALLLIKMH